MAMRMTLSTRNLEGQVARFNAVVPRAVAAARKVVRETGEAAFADVWQDVPVDTGYMRDTLRLLFASDGLAYELGWQEVDYLPYGLAFYPVYVIFGTQYMAGRDVLFPNHRAAKAEFRPKLHDALGNAVRAGNRRRRRAA